MSIQQEAFVKYMELYNLREMFEEWSRMSFEQYSENPIQFILDHNEQRILKQEMSTVKGEVADLKKQIKKLEQLEEEKHDDLIEIIVNDKKEVEQPQAISSVIDTYSTDDDRAN